MWRILVLVIRDDLFAVQNASALSVLCVSGAFIELLGSMERLAVAFLKEALVELVIVLSEPLKRPGGLFVASLKEIEEVIGELVVDELADEVAVPTFKRSEEVCGYSSFYGE